MNQTLRQISKEKSQGQILIIMALIFILLITIIGLVIDMGFIYVSYSRLRRAVDAAGLSATMQFKKNVDVATLQKAAREFLVLNGVPDTTSLSAKIDTCDSLPGDPELCPTGDAPRRKLVRVTAREDVPLFFMAIIGFKTIPIEVSTTSEAATVDVVLVLDRSESMGIYKANNVDRYPVGSINLDPYHCNDSHPSTTIDGSSPSQWTGDCHPFHEVKSAALAFVNEFMDPGFDRVAIVVFDNEAYPINFGTTANPVYFSYDIDQIRTAIRGLWMYDGFHDSGVGADLRKPDEYYKDGIAQKGNACDYLQPIGGEPADAIFDPLPGVNQPPCRLLDMNDGFYTIDCYGRWNNVLYGTADDYSRCGSTNIGRGLWWAARIFQLESREESLLVTILLTDGVPNAGYDEANKPICPVALRSFSKRSFTNDPGNYDTDDYSRDWADTLADPDSVGSLIFAIGLGNVSPPLLNYISETGQTGSYYQANPDDLQKIFLAIANKIATRLVK